MTERYNASFVMTGCPPKVNTQPRTKSRGVMKEAIDEFPEFQKTLRIRTAGAMGNPTRFLIVVRSWETST